MDRQVLFPLTLCSSWDKITHMQLGDVLRKWRLMRDLTVREAAKVMGLSVATLSRIERGENMDGAVLAKILTWLLQNVEAPHA